jgi:hypothetical protein
MRGRSKHGHLVRTWLRLNRPDRRKNRALVSAYLTSEEFVADFAALDPERRWLALEAVREAIERFQPRPPHTPPVGRIKWSRSPEWQQRICDAARRLPDDKAIAREFGLSVNAAKVARWRYAGRRDKPHIARIAA